MKLRDSIESQPRADPGSKDTDPTFFFCPAVNLYSVEVSWGGGGGSKEV